MSRQCLDDIVMNYPMFIVGNPDQCRANARENPVNQAADALCYCGLIRRWSLADGATLDANGTLNNDWFLTQEDEARR